MMNRIDIPKWLYDDNQPDYRRLRVLPFVIYTAVFFFGVSYGFFWALLEPFGFGDHLLEKICGENVGKWLILVVLSIFTSITITLFKLYRYYRSLYRDFKTSNLFYNVYPNRTWLEDHYVEFLKKAKKDFFLVSVSGYSFTATPHIDEIIEKKITSSENKCKVRILIHHEDALSVEIRESDERREPGDIIRDCRQNYGKWHKFFKKNSSRLFEIKRQKDFSIGSFCLKVDDVIYFEPYLAYNSGRHCPLFEIRKNPTNERVYNAILTQMKKLWQTAEN